MMRWPSEAAHPPVAPQASAPVQHMQSMWGRVAPYMWLMANGAELLCCEWRIAQRYRRERSTEEARQMASLTGSHLSCSSVSRHGALGGAKGATSAHNRVAIGRAAVRFPRLHVTQLLAGRRRPPRVQSGMCTSEWSIAQSCDRDSPTHTHTRALFHQSLCR